MTSTTLTLLAGALVLLVIYFVKTYTYWQRRKVPTPDGSVPILGHMWPVYTVAQNLRDHFDTLYKKCNKHSMFGIYDMFTPTLVICEPQLIKTVLQSSFGSFHENGIKISAKTDPLLAQNPFFNDGEEWSTGRKRLTYAFSNVKLKSLFIAVTGVCKKQQTFLERQLKAQNKYECELKHFIGRFMAESVANAGLGVEGYSYEDNPPPNSFHTIGLAIFNPGLFTAILTNFFVLKPHVAISLGFRFVPEAVDKFFRQVVRENLEFRRKDTTTRNDFFQLMVDMEKSEGVELNEETIVAHTLSLFIDGFETSRLTLSFVVYQLAVHPEIQVKLKDEIRSVLAKNNGELTFEALKDFKYMEQVISESQRYHSPVTFLHKQCTEPCVLTGSDGLSVKMKPGMHVYIPISNVHRDPECWSDPEVFDPDRFSEERKQNIEKMSFIPFGEGPRMCVGMKMAMLMMKCCLCSFLNNYKVELSPKTTLPLKWSKYRFMCEPANGFWVYISKA